LKLKETCKPNICEKSYTSLSLSTLQKKEKRKKKDCSPREPLWIFLVSWPPWAGFLEELEMYKPSLQTSGKRKMGF